MKNKIFSVFVLALFLACGSDDDQSEDNKTSYSYEFSSGTEGWISDFADYPAGEEEKYQLTFQHSPLPDPLDNTQSSLMLSGMNHSDDLFMFVKKEITGLTPNHEYLVNFWIEFASNESEGQFGAGGSPGESVYLKVGAVPEEPEKNEDEEGWYRLDIDKGNQADDGEDMMTIGNFANGTEENVYALKSLSNSVPLQVTTSSEGTLWLLVGTDSGFEGATTIYINQIEVELLQI